MSRGETSQFLIDDAAEARARTMQVRALRRLSECEVAGLGVALRQLETLEVALVAALPKMREAADKEAAARRARGYPMQGGPFVQAWLGVRALLLVVGDAREETSLAEASGRVAKR